MISLGVMREVAINIINMSLATQLRSMIKTDKVYDSIRNVLAAEDESLSNEVL